MYFKDIKTLQHLFFCGEMRNDLTYAEMRNSWGQIFITASLDPLPPSQQIIDIPSVERALAQTENTGKAVP